MTLLQECRNLVKSNINKELSDETVEILSVAVLGLMLIKPELTLRKMPSILQNLDIYAENKTILEMSHEKLGNYDEDQWLAYGDATVTTSYCIDESNNIQEKNTLLISMNSSSTISKVNITIHEFLHLLRHFSYTFDNNKLTRKSGIEIATCDFNNKTRKRKHYNLEDGIVQFYANMATDELVKYTGKDTSKVLKDISFEYETFNPEGEYSLQLFLLKKLNENTSFEELLDLTFEEKTSKELPLYFNSVLFSPTAFTSFSRNIDETIKSIYTSSNDAQIKLFDLINTTDLFLEKSKRRPYTKRN